ncbi:MAG: ATP phosphoribosyltransferase regulatory subunit, partial [Proteobacteria bacterium]|nr:ATP phosphoribosyltransferase regulatory subunit [Pseudomonadota bacterium]
ASDLPLLRDLIQATGTADAALAALRTAPLPDQARALVGDLEAVVGGIRELVPSLAITIDPGEFRGFEYHAGLSFAFFGRGIRGELGRGGRYMLEDGGPATGFTMYLDSLLRALPGAPPTPHIYIPCDVARSDGQRLRNEGWRTVHGLGNVADPRSEALRLGCTHLYIDGAISALDHEK